MNLERSNFGSNPKTIVWKEKFVTLWKENFYSRDTYDICYFTKGKFLLSSDGIFMNWVADYWNCFNPMTSCSLITGEDK